MYRRLLALIKPYKWYLGIAMGCMALEAAATSAIPFLIKPTLDEIFVNRDLDRLYLITSLVVAAFLAKAIFFFLQAYIMSYVGQTVVNNLRVRLYRHLQTLSLSFFQRNSTGVLTSRITNDVAMLQNAVTEAITGMVMDICRIIGLTFVIFYLNWKLALLGILIIPFGGGPLYFFGRYLRSLARETQVRMGSLTSILNETFQGARIVKAFGMEEYENERQSRESKKLLILGIKMVAVRAFTSSMMEILGGISIAVIIFYEGFSVVKGRSSPGSLMSFLTALVLLYDPIRRLSRMNAVIQQGIASAERVFSVLDEEPEIKNKDSALVLPPITKQVEFRDVWFGYTEDKVLKGINLTVKAGEALAIVGMSGVGKTTLVDLIPRFYDVDEGAILIDGVDIRNVTMESLRAQLAFVSQRIILFDDTVRNNIAYGSRERSLEEIEAAARAAFAYDFIMDMPQGFDAFIGERGVRLSGGERQRLAIARALLKNAPILILDEATSSLDARSEAEVQAAFNNLMKGRTTFIIAHRLSTVRDVNRIIVLAGGQIVEEGSHDSLMARGGEYKRLYEMQFRESGQISAGQEISKTA
ncbi:MAG: ATP-binding cassette domain-containing protein [Deltaproteobacteria bacterium]|nr:ATP-binding cassette domain-containing protein [Deltaproteobacteria bacterium]